MVVGHERLYSDLVRANKDNKGVTILRLAKSGGVSYTADASNWNRSSTETPS